MCTYAIYEEAVTGMTAPNPTLFFMAISHVIHAFFMYAHFLGDRTVAQNKGPPVMLNGE
jgi:hypothetical protein